MTNWQWKVIIALCRLVLELIMKTGLVIKPKLNEEYLLLHEAIRRDEDNDL